MKIAIIGTVGVPARYGGFETLAEQLARGVDPAQHALVVYCQRSAYPELKGGERFSGHQRVLVPLRANGAASMLHDVLAMLHALLFTRPHTMLVLGYSGAWFLPVVRLLRPGMRVVTNIDGMEWRRDKFGPRARKVLRALEWFAVRFSHRVIADNAALVSLARELHGIEPALIAYGGDHSVVPAAPASGPPPGYHLAIARIEPENNCHLILQACATAQVRMVFVGNWGASDFGRKLKARFESHSSLTLLDPIYELDQLAALRAGASGYIHGHSVGGTNPSLVEALFHTNRLLSFDCAFNRATLDDAGGYFASESALVRLLQDANSGSVNVDRLQALRDRYRWTGIVGEYISICTA